MNNPGCFFAPLHGPDNSFVAGHDIAGQKDFRVVRPAVGEILLSGFQLRDEAAQIRELPHGENDLISLQTQLAVDAAVPEDKAAAFGAHRHVTVNDGDAKFPRAFEFRF